jgi:hypothetical protein
MPLQSLARPAAILATLLFGIGSLQAQEAARKSNEDQSAAMNSVLAKMNEQMDIPEVPEDQRASREQIDKLFDSLRLRDQLDKTMQMASMAFKAGIEQAIEEKKQKNPNKKELTPQEQQQFENMMSEYMKKLAAVIYSDDVMNPIKSAYQRYLTSSDVEGITAFYSSPAGKHLLERQTKIGLAAAPQMMAAMQAKIQPLMAQMQANLDAAKKAVPASK